MRRRALEKKKNARFAIRVLDVLLSVIGLIILTPLILLIILILFVESGSPFFLQVRLGKDKKPFVLVKFRTMKKDAPVRPTHEISRDLVTPFGRVLRKTKLDELPQLWNVLKGEMSLVGPRPCLPEQYDLIKEREKRGVFEYLPGITGLAQINGVDMSEPRRLAELDALMLSNLSIRSYFYYLIMTVLGRGAGDRVRDT